MTAVNLIYHNPETKIDQAEEQQETSLSPLTIDLAAQDIRAVLDQQREQSQILTTKLNILFVVNGALLTSLTISKLIYTLSVFSSGEIIGFLLNFTLLINAFLPRQVAVSPNLEDNIFKQIIVTLIINIPN